MITLYKRNNYGEPILWSVHVEVHKLYIKYGIVGKTETIEVLEHSDASRDALSRVNQKRKEGYKELSELFDNAPNDLFLSVDERINYLNTYLPKFNTDNNGTAKPMLAKTYEYKNGANRMAQWKVNGLRCFISAAKTNDLFAEFKLVFTSREGIVWNQLKHLNEVLLNMLPDKVKYDMIYNNYILDGELYIPGLTVNEINHLVKDPTDKRHKDLQFWCYDIAIENTTQARRTEYLQQELKNVGFHNNDSSIKYLKDFHFNNTNKLVVLPYVLTNNEDDCFKYRDIFKDAGFEGVILRDFNSEYQFGRRNNTMLKFKPIYDGYFKIIDIIPEGAKRATLPKFICHNDINAEVFECTIRGSFESQAEYLTNKHLYIDKYVLVEYRERSGVKSVPFHGKAIKIKIE